MEKDEGLYKCWNEAIKISTGEYLINANLDDRMAVDKIEKCVKMMYLEDLDVVYHDFYLTNVKNETFEKNSSEGRKYATFPEYDYNMLKMFNLCHASVLWKKNLHDKYGYFREDMKSASDWEMWLRLGMNGCKFKKHSDVLGLYLYAEHGISTDPANFEWKREEERKVYELYKDTEFLS